MIDKLKAALWPWIPNGGIIAIVSAAEAEQWLKNAVLILTALLTAKKLFSKGKKED